MKTMEDDLLSFVEQILMKFLQFVCLMDLLDSDEQMNTKDVDVIWCENFKQVIMSCFLYEVNFLKSSLKYLIM